MGEYKNDILEKSILYLESRAYDLIGELDRGYQIKELRELKEFKLACIFRQIESAKKSLSV